MSEEIDNRPKNAFEAAIDRATGYVPGDENRVVSDAGQDGQCEDGGAEAAEVGSASETKPAEDETKLAEAKENAEPVKEKRDWVNEAYECFIKNAVDLEPTDPVEAIEAYFEKNATYELKAKSVAEGKTYESCWKFVEAVARKALGGRSGHIDPVAVYAIAMHYFQDVPKDWDKVEKPARREAAGVRTAKAKANGKAKTRKVEELERKIAQPGSAKRAQELKAKIKAEKERVKEKEKKRKAKKRGGEQGFFFDLMETETVGPKEEVK